MLSITGKKECRRSDHGMSITRIIMSDESSRRWKASLMAGSLGFMFGAVAVSFFVRCPRRQRGPINDRIYCNERTRRPSRTDSEQGVPLVEDVIVPPPFLWEPQATTPRRQKAAFRHTSSERRFSGPYAGIPITAISENVFTVISKDNNNEHQQREQQQQQQLEFLSTMTFANGGIRAPSCPCCQ